MLPPRLNCRPGPSDRAQEVTSVEQHHTASYERRTTSGVGPSGGRQHAHAHDHHDERARTTEKASPLTFAGGDRAASQPRCCRASLSLVILRVDLLSETTVASSVKTAAAERAVVAQRAERLTALLVCATVASVACALVLRGAHN